MPPKRSDTIHVTFHFYRSAVLLSVSSSTTISSLKSQFLLALQPLSNTLPTLPVSTNEFKLFEEKPLVEGAENGGNIQVVEIGDEDPTISKKTIGHLGWPRWKKVFVSFKQDGQFSDPVFTIPDLEDEEPAE